MIENKLFHRKSIRLPHFEYTLPGPYFITICTQNKLRVFGSIQNGLMILNTVGNLVDQIWMELPEYYPGVMLDEYIVMPDHMHGIVYLNIQNEYEHVGESKISFSDLVHRFKSYTTAKYRQGVRDYGWPRFPGRLWQRNYYEEVIRNEDHLNKKRDYIHNNPYKWWEKQHNEELLAEMKRRT